MGGVIYQSTIDVILYKYDVAYKFTQGTCVIGFDKQLTSVLVLG